MEERLIWLAVAKILHVLASFGMHLAAVAQGLHCGVHVFALCSQDSQEFVWTMHCCVLQPVCQALADEPS